MCGLEFYWHCDFGDNRDPYLRVNVQHLEKCLLSGLQVLAIDIIIPSVCSMPRRVLTGRQVREVLDFVNFWNDFLC